MTAISPDPDCAEFATTVLDWLETGHASPSVVDETFRLLADRRRRLAIEVLQAYEEALTLADLAEAITERETGQPIVEISAERVSRVYLSLYHDHIPRLEDVGLLEYDQERDLVSPAAI